MIAALARCRDGSHIYARSRIHSSPFRPRAGVHDVSFCKRGQFGGRPSSRDLAHHDSDARRHLGRRAPNGRDPNWAMDEKLRFRNWGIGACRSVLPRAKAQMECRALRDFTTAAGHRVGLKA